MRLIGIILLMPFALLSVWLIGFLFFIVIPEIMVDIWQSALMGKILLISSVLLIIGCIMIGMSK